MWKVIKISGWYRCSTSKVVSMMQEQNGKCAYCYHKFNVNDKFLKPTLDHVNARSKWGSESDEKNIVIACFKCNMKKGNISVEHFLDGYIKWDIGWREQGDDTLQTLHTMKKIRGSRKFYHKFIWYSL